MPSKTEKVAYSIKYISNAMEKRMNVVFKEYDITFTQARAIVFLYKSECSVPMKEMEKEFEVTQQTMLGIVKRLEEKDFLISVQDESDKRIKRVELTETGKSLGVKLAGKMNENFDKMDRVLSGEEVDCLYTILSKLVNNLK